MKKKKQFLMISSLLCLVMAVSACTRQGETPSNTQETTKVSEKETIKKEQIAMEEYKKVPYKLYPTSKDAWVGDVMPMSDGETLQLYYLYDTDHNGPAYHPIHKFSTENFYEYSDDGLVINYGTHPEDPDYAIGTGSVLIGQDGKYHCFYTGHNDNAPERGADKECVMHAVSDDNITWTKIPEDTFYVEDHYSSDDFRDPFVFWNEEEEQYWLLIAAREETLGGVVAKYTSKDLSTWELCEPLFAPKKQYMLECPDLFKMGDYYYLFYSWDCVTYYAMSDSIYGPFVEPENNILDGTGFCFYAAKTAELKGNRYLCGWVGRKETPEDGGNYNWAGSMLIHQLVQKEDGRLGVKAPDTLDSYFVQEKELMVNCSDNVEQRDGSYKLSAPKDDIAIVDLGMREPTMILDCKVTFDEKGTAGFAFGIGEKYERYVGLVLDAKRNCIHYEGCILSRIPYVVPGISTDFAFELGKEYNVKLVVENEIVVLYINDEKALSNRIYKSIDGANIALFTNGTTCTFTDVIKRVPEK